LNNRITPILLLAILLVISCTDKIVEPEVFSETGLIRFTGAPAVDGCDWVIELPENKVVHPNDLPQSYLVDSLKVAFTYSPTDHVFTCGWGVELPVITILGIQKE
tara:strand:- start:123186 stop:123500 length:315 start_codon:yes stop_codon:yes gene_type:complete